MGEYIGASIRFGGRISTDKADELIEIINDVYSLGVDFDGDEATRENLHETFGNWEINYGDLDDLKNFATANGLHYLYWCDDGCEWDPQTEVYDAETKEVHSITSTEGGPALTRSEIERLGSIEAVMRFFDQFEKDNFPKLEIMP